MARTPVNEHGTHDECDETPWYACIACHAIHVREKVLVWDGDHMVPAPIDWPEEA